MSVTSVDEVAADAIAFWQHNQGGSLSDADESWIRQQVGVLMTLWRDIGRLSRNRDMWRELTQELESIDPRCAWTRHYDRIYFEAQLLLLTRSVKARRRGRQTASLEHLVEGFAGRPWMTKRLDLGHIRLPDVGESVDPRADIANLNRVLKPLMTIRDKFAAHTEIGARLPEFGWPELDATIDAVIPVFSRYSQRLTGVVFQVDFSDSSLKGWHNVFRNSLFGNE